MSALASTKGWGIFWSATGFSLLALVLAGPACGATLSLDPVNKNLAPEEVLRVQLSIDTENEQVTSADVVLTYDSSILEIADIIDGNGQEQFFPEVFKRIRGNEIYIGPAVKTRADAKAGQGVIATITFKGKQAGISGLDFDCTPGSTSDSNIAKNDPAATDILDCTRLINGRYIVGGSTGPTPTLTPTSPTATNLPTATPISPEPSPTTTPTLALGEPTSVPTPTPTTENSSKPSHPNPNFTPLPTRKLPNVGVTEPTRALLAIGLMIVAAGVLLLRP